MGLQYGFWLIFLLLLNQDHYIMNYYTLHVYPIIAYSPSNEMFGAARLDGTHWFNNVCKEVKVAPQPRVPLATLDIAPRKG
jgi:hypothetical protein